MSHRLLLGAALVLAAMSAPALAETFDITTYTPPTGWSVETKKDVVIYTTVDQRAGTFCRIQLYSSTPASGNVKADFAADWRELVVSSFKGAAVPTRLVPVKSDDGWDVYTGVGSTKFNNLDTALLQIVAFHGGRRVPMTYFATSDCSAQLGAFTDSVSFSGSAVAAAAPAPSTDAWSATPQADWVEVTSKAGKVLVHFPNAKADAYDSVLANSVRTAWATLVAPHYASVTNLVVKPIQSYESVTFAEADAVENGTNKPVHVVLFKLHDYKGQNRYLEFVNDSKAAFESAWGAYRASEFGWDKLVAMGNYDRFTVTPAALAGTWTSTDFASISYYYASTGRAAGTDATSTAASFTFDGKGGYSSDYTGASGAVGQAKFSRVQYRGAYSVDQSGIKMTLTNRFKGKSESYTAYFRAVKGGNILVLIDAQNSVTYLGKK
ncbi:hypothetical protein BH11MYX2_BH11MYX2_17320 [soil metagenome]